MSESIEGRPSSLPPQPSQSYPAPSNIPATGPPVNPELPTLPYPTQSVLGRKRGYVSGTFAHVLANGPKAPKVSDQVGDALTECANILRFSPRWCTPLRTN